MAIKRRLDPRQAWYEWFLVGVSAFVGITWGSVALARFCQGSITCGGWGRTIDFAFGAPVALCLYPPLRQIEKRRALDSDSKGVLLVRTWAAVHCCIAVVYLALTVWPLVLFRNYDIGLDTGIYWLISLTIALFVSGLVIAKRIQVRLANTRTTAIGKRGS